MENRERTKHTERTRPERPLSDWLPITKKEVESRGWERLDVILVSGDAYVDHPSFGAAVIGRVLEHDGFRVAAMHGLDRLVG
ncbi:MAG: hypothetical protein K2G46_05065, partial [Bacteroidales bacterium]|nr:hypothetical protein [Bacteroidales bacterium]